MHVSSIGLKRKKMNYAIPSRETKCCVALPRLPKEHLELLTSAINLLDMDNLNMSKGKTVYLLKAEGEQIVDIEKLKDTVVWCGPHAKILRTHYGYDPDYVDRKDVDESIHNALRHGYIEVFHHNIPGKHYISVLRLKKFKHLYSILPTNYGTTAIRYMRTRALQVANNTIRHLYPLLGKSLPLCMFFLQIILKDIPNIAVLDNLYELDFVVKWSLGITRKWFVTGTFQPITKKFIIQQQVGSVVQTFLDSFHQ
jgi:hypothetical protein